MNYHVYTHDFGGPVDPEPAIGPAYTCSFWRPGLTSVMPQGVPRLRFAVWWAMHYLHGFANRQYGIFLVRSGGLTVHRTCLFPRYFSFPFMGKDDLQIGEVWTASEHRGKGLAAFGIRNALTAWSKPGRRFWYIVREDNVASIRAAEKAGLAKVGQARKLPRFGVLALGRYVLENESRSS